MNRVGKVVRVVVPQKSKVCMIIAETEDRRKFFAFIPKKDIPVVGKVGRKIVMNRTGYVYLA